MLDSQPGTLILNDCIETCRKNSSCKSINFETGLCVLFSSSADDNKSQLTKSQYPVFTIYVQKNCLPSAASCNGAWSFERVMDHQLDTEVSPPPLLPVTNPFSLRSRSPELWGPGRSVWSSVSRRSTSSAGERHQSDSSVHSNLNITIQTT